MVVEDLSKIFGSKTKAREILLLLSGSKKLVRQAYFTSEIVFKDFFTHHSIAMVVSPYKVRMAERGYVNRGELGDDGMHFVYFSASEELCFRAALAEAKGNHKLLGQLLGYPDCCVDYFSKEFSTNNDPQLESSFWQLNLSKRSEDAVLLSHFPCQDCLQSLELAKEYFDVLKELDGEDSEKLKKNLDLK